MRATKKKLTAINDILEKEKSVKFFLTIYIYVYIYIYIETVYN
jgi:hypothetical protein